MANECDHVPHYWPFYKKVAGQSRWHAFFHGSNVTLHWYCCKCHVEMEPVFKVTEKSDGK